MPLANIVTLGPDGAPLRTPPPLPPGPSTKAESEAALAPGSAKMAVFDPTAYRLSGAVQDPIFLALQQFKWSDRQQHGRIAYDTMYKHPAVAAIFDSLILFLKSYRPLFKPAGSNPTDLQKELAAFANEQLRRLGVSGDARQGYEKLIDGFIAQGLKYGFSLAEMETVSAPWNGQRAIQIRRILPLPQATLDNGFVPLEEFGQGILTSFDVRYHCIEQNERGDILAVHQFYRNGTATDQITWRGNELQRLLHFVHEGGEGNPYGKSMFFSAFYAWAALYAIEAMEEAFLDAGLPYLTASYKTKDGVPSPALHAQFLEIISQQDPALRAFIMPDTTFSSVAPSNPSFTEHVTRKKDELRRYIQNCIFGVPVSASHMGNELDARNSIQVFFNYLLPALQREISTLLTWQFSRRLIDANWSRSKVAESDYPELVFVTRDDNGLRIATPIIQQILRFVRYDRMGEALERMVDGFDGSWIATDPADTFESHFGAMNPAAGSTVGQPTKPENTPDTKLTGDTSSIGQQVQTVA